MSQSYRTLATPLRQALTVSHTIRFSTGRSSTLKPAQTLPIANHPINLSPIRPLPTYPSNNFLLGFRIILPIYIIISSHTDHHRPCSRLFISRWAGCNNLNGRDAKSQRDDA